MPHRQFLRERSTSKKLIVLYCWKVFSEVFLGMRKTHSLCMY